MSDSPIHMPATSGVAILAAWVVLSEGDNLCVSELSLLVYCDSPKLPTPYNERCRWNVYYQYTVYPSYYYRVASFGWTITKNWLKHCLSFRHYIQVSDCDHIHDSWETDLFLHLFSYSFQTLNIFIRKTYLQFCGVAVGRWAEVTTVTICVYEWWFLWRTFPSLIYKPRESLLTSRFKLLN